MYLEKIVIQNYGCLKDLNYLLPFNEDGTPKPVVIIGRNGSGKTLLLSNIIHSLIEFKRKHYKKLRETNEKVYRIGSKKYINNEETFSYINYQFSENNFYTYLTTTNYKDFIDKKYNKDIHIDVDINDEKLIAHGFYHKASHKNIKQFKENVYLYFPVDRYYFPRWLNNTISNERAEDSLRNTINANNVNMIKNNVLKDIESWILDVLIDMYLYEEGNIGSNSDIFNQLNKIISKIFTLNSSKYKSARLAISRKKSGNREIAIYKKDIDELEIQYVPSFNNLSSGEIMILSIFASILKEYDRVSEYNEINFSEIKGIVIIDEIDVHLHLDFCKVVLPEIIKIFTGIQFIVSSHSPFFLLGMKESFEDECEFINLPDGTLNNLDKFEEIKGLYELVYKDHEETLTDFEGLREKLKNIEKPLVITEGKTDWKHFKNALLKFQEQGIHADLDIKFDEYEDDLGDSKLDNLLKNLARKPNANKIIGIFDNDEDMGRKYDTQTPVSLGNNVYGWCIPNDRDLPYGISVEFLYDEADIKTIDSQGRRIFLSNEFSEKSMKLLEDKTINTTNKKVIECYKKHTVKIIDSDVFDNEDDSIALSKNDFATNILNRTKPFNSINIDGFKGVFDRISHIINNC